MRIAARLATAGALWAGSALAQETTPRIGDPVLLAVQRLELTLPATIYSREPVQTPLGSLAREKCDQKAIVELGQALDKVGYRRDAANAHMRFAQTCPGFPEAWQRATNFLLGLSDYKKAIEAADHLIKEKPEYDNGYFLRAAAHDKLGEAKKAIDDYVTATELFPAKERISSVGYVAIARNYASLGQFCDAASAIQAWVAHRPEANDSSQTRALIADYETKGHCDALSTAGVEEFRVSKPGNTVILPVSINGVRGNFILDTGATFTSMKASFAAKAKVKIDADSALKLHSANGIADAKSGRAAQIQLRSLKASNVAIVVQADDKGTYGDGVDGLLGMSFLSNFKLTIDAKTVRVTGRLGK